MVVTIYLIALLSTKMFKPLLNFSKIQVCVCEASNLKPWNSQAKN